MVLWERQGVLLEKQKEVKRHDKPPIITLDEASGYTFWSGSAELAPAFQEALSGPILQQLQKIADEFRVDVIEVIGHTDGQVVATHTVGNLDRKLELVAQSSEPQAVVGLVPSTNADLGLMRALSVIKYLQLFQNQGFLRSIHFRAYSSAQLLLPNGQFAPPARAPDASRRRIELRFTRSGELQ